MALRRIVFLLAAVAVGVYYLWAVRATGHPFQWGRDLNGYYNYLGQSLAKGHLDLPVKPAPELLALPDPYDPNADSTHKLWDAALFHGRYYLYHGVGPAVILFAPWRLLTRHDLPENFALFLFCFGGYLFSCGALLRILSLAGARPGPAMLPALGLCQSIPYLLNRVWVYEIAIGGGYFCVSGAFFLLARSIGSRRATYWLAGSGLMFGLAVSCRPTLALAAATALGGLALTSLRPKDRNWRDLLAFTVPLAALGAGIALYNYARFDNPFEFGLPYLLSGPNQNRLKLESANLLPGLYYNLFCRPAFDAVFPWIRIALRHPAHPLPKEYFLEPTAGAWFLAPFIAGALLVPRGAARIFLWTLTASGAAILLFLAATGFVTQRYEADFLPPLALAALANAGICLSRSTGWRRIALGFLLTASIGFGAVVNLALGLSGPYDDVLKNRPVGYARLARWLSPVAALRPVMNPRLDVAFSAGFAQVPEGVPEPLLTIGRAPYTQILYAERHADNLRIVLKTGDSSATYDMPAPGTRPVAFEMNSARGSGKLVVAIDGREALAADAGIVFTAPSQVTLDAGSIRVVRKIVDGGT